MKVSTTKKDVFWNYLGTLVSMASGFILLPMLLLFLSEDELGLWYVFVAISNFTMLFEFGFNPTFARNIVYCISGVKSLSKEGKTDSDPTSNIDFGLLKRLMTSCKVVYAAISFVALLLLLFLGTFYVTTIASGLPAESYLPAWAVMVAAVFVNIYFLYTQTFLRGFGDIAGENQGRVLSRLTQIVVSGLLLLLGFGLMSATIGFFANAVIIRLYAYFRLKKHASILEGVNKEKGRVSRAELKETVATIWHLAWRDGIVQLSSFASSQAMSIVCSLFLGLAETGLFSITVQLSGAVTSLSSAFVKSYYPAFQSAFARDEVDEMRAIAQRGLSIYYFATIVGCIGVALFILPLIPLLKPGYLINLPFFVCMTAFNLLSVQYSIFCNFIVNTNRIPYMWSYLISGIASIVLSCVFLAVFDWGVWGILLGQTISQGVYNFWKWPKFMLDELETSLPETLMCGFRYWITYVKGKVSKQA